MNNQAIKAYIRAIFAEYQQASKKKKSELLNHAELATKRDRKVLIRKLNGSQDELTKKTSSGRPSQYNKQDLLPHIRYLWLQMERISAPRMKEAFADWLPRYHDCPAHLSLQLERMSASTLERYLKEVRASQRAFKGLATTSPARFMKNKVPINTLDAKITKPGHVQTDTVAHCGTSMAGHFLSSITVTDVYSTWTENRSISEKTGKAVAEMMKDIERSLPFDLIAINSDSGSEFLNKPMLKYTHFGQRIAFTRSRPYKKNDNCYVEQKNFTHVRELFGYDRFEDPKLVTLMNEIYTQYWNPLQNFFLPTFKLKEKIRVGSSIKKKHGKPQTPYSRLINDEHLSDAQKEQLRTKKAELNPFELKSKLEQKLQEFFDGVRKLNTRKAA